MINNKFSWYINRFKKMSFSEILWRIENLNRHKLYKKKFKNHNIGINSLVDFDGLYSNVLSYNEFDVSFLDIRSNSTDFSSEPCFIFNQKKLNLKGNGLPNWHHSNYSDKEWPKKFSLDLNIKQRDDIGDPRVTWEINRLQHLPGIALKYSVSEEKKYIVLLKSHFYDWINENSFMKGVNWTSPMEAALRNISLILVCVFLGEVNISKEKELKDDILSSINNTYNYIKNNYSKHSSANNHLIVELVSNFLVSVCFNNDKEWTTIVKQLNKEILTQNYSDGINKEQAIHYHAFVLEALLFFVKFSEDKGIGISKDVLDRIEKMAEYLADMMDDNGNVPNLGDSDDGKIFSFVNENHYVTVLELAEMIFNKRYTECKSKNVEIIRWKQLANKAYNKEKLKLYPHGGKIIYRDVNNNRNILFTLEFGGLGLPPLYAHGHCDALSFNLHIDGVPIFIDPGTYLYNVESNTRDAIRMEDMHNTISVKDKQFAQSKGAFIWSSDYQDIKLLDYAYNKFSLQFKLIDGSTIKRTIVIKEGTIRIFDQYQGALENNFIINPNLKISTLDKRSVKIFNNENTSLCTLLTKSNQFDYKSISGSFYFSSLVKMNKLSVKGEKSIETEIVF